MSNGTPEGIICNALPLSTMKLAFTFFLQDYFIAGVVEHRVVPPINCMQVGTKKREKNATTKQPKNQTALWSK